MKLKLSPRTVQILEIVFKSEEVAEASRWLEEECGNNLPFQNKSNEFQLERIRFAAIKLSHGNMQKLLKAIDEARRDWRDLLMAADFGNHLDAHETWAKEILNEP